MKSTLENRIKEFNQLLDRSQLELFDFHPKRVNEINSNKLIYRLSFTKRIEKLSRRKWNQFHLLFSFCFVLKQFLNAFHSNNYSVESQRIMCYFNKMSWITQNNGWITQKSQTFPFSFRLFFPIFKKVLPSSWASIQQKLHFVIPMTGKKVENWMGMFGIFVLFICYFMLFMTFYWNNT